MHEHIERRWFTETVLTLLQVQNRNVATAMRGCQTRSMMLAGLLSLPLVAQQWVAQNGLPWRAGTDVTYDPGNQRLLMFGGHYVGYGVSNPSGVFQDTWCRDATGWHEVSVPQFPPARSDYSMVFDTVRQRAVLFGGYRPGVGYNNETWEFDGQNWLQAQPVNQPMQHEYPTMTYDTVRGRTVLHGGYAAGGWQPETWEYDGLNWTLIPTLASPTGNDRGVMQFSPAIGRCVFVAYATSTSTTSTWLYDGVTWSQASPSSSPTYVGSMSVDASGNILMLSRDPSVANSTLTWRYNGNNWTTIPTPHTPPATCRGPIVFDAAQGRNFLCSHATTGQFDGNDWQLVDELRHTWPRRSAARAFDTGRNRWVMFGGFREGWPSGPGATNEHWEWNGNEWLVIPQAIAPSARVEAVMAYDSARQRLILAGGFDGPGEALGTWEYDGQQWSETIAANNPMLDLQAMAYDPVSDECIAYTAMFGTFPIVGTWRYQGTYWEHVLTVDQPPARCNPNMVYDAARNRIVMYGGTNNNANSRNDTWEYHGGNWLEVVMPTPPPAAWSSMTFDSVRGRPVIAVAVDPPGYYELHNGQWLQLPATSASGNTGTITLEFDPHNRQLLATAQAGEIWRLEPAATPRWATFGTGCSGSGTVPPVLLSHSGTSLQHDVLIPNNSALRGMHLAVQVATVDLAQPFGLGALSNAGVGTLF